MPASTAVAAAADQDDRALRVIRARELLHLADEVRVDLPVGPVVPCSVQGAHRVADEQKFHFAAAVDEQRVGVLAQELLHLLGLEMVHGTYYRT
jgi:hypothetical protein